MSLCAAGFVGSLLASGGSTSSSSFLGVSTSLHASACQVRRRSASARPLCAPERARRSSAANSRWLMMGKKKRTVDDDEGGNAINVFGNSDMTQEELLAQALGEDRNKAKPSAGAALAKEKKKKKGKASSAEEEGDADASKQEVAIEAENGNTAVVSNGHDAEKSKKKQGKTRGGGAEAQEPLPVTELELDDEVEAKVADAADVADARAKKAKGKKKGRRSSETEEDESLVVPVFKDDSKVTSEPQGGLEEGSNGTDSRAEEDDSRSKKVAGRDAEEGGDNDDEERVGTLDIRTELDTETAEEFESFASTVEDFTRRGAKKRAENVKRVSLSDSATTKNVSVQLIDVGVTFKNADVLTSVTWSVRSGERVGLVGKNGTGKTTLLKIIADQLEATSGEVVRSSTRIRSSFLRQEFVDELNLELPLRDELKRGCAVESAKLKRYYELEQQVSDAGEDMGKMEQLLNEMDDVRKDLDAVDGWNLDARIDKLLPALGFDQEDLEAAVGSFSGGWKVRIGLGKILLQRPDLLLLDEPTNHLDLDSVEWLEKFLSGMDIPMVIVSHDREFMDRLCTKIVELEAGEAFEYRGNYTTFVAQKAERFRQWDAAYERQQKFLDEQRAFIRRFSSSPARAAQVKSREKMIERLQQSTDWVRRPPRSGKPLVFRFPPAPRSGRDVCIVEDVEHGYGNVSLFRNASFVLERGDRVAIVGPNGCGKSTLLRLVMGIESPVHGEVECKSLHNVLPAFFEQNQADALDLNKTVLETVREAANDDMRYEDIRAVLGKFLFKGSSVDKPVSALSGGEKARVALCKMMVSPANFLVLDEPTNHLDIPAKEMLEEALQNFDGTLLVVSHDRYFVSQVAKQILSIDDGEVVLHDGDYKSYIEKDKRLREQIQERVIDGLTNLRSAPEVEIVDTAGTSQKKKKKSFGGSGVTSGKTKEMNAKRWSR